MKTGNRDQGTEISSAEETLRLIARLDAPEGLEERVQEGLRAAAVHSAQTARTSGWPAWLSLSCGWMLGAPMRAAAAAAIVAVVAGGGWIVNSRVSSPLPAQSGMAAATSSRTAAPGGFSPAGAMRTPQTLDRPLVATPAEAPPQKATSPAKEKAGPPTAQKPRHPGKLTPDKKHSVESAGSAAK